MPGQSNAIIPAMEFFLKPDNLIVTLSSLSYLLSGILIFRANPFISLGLILMTCIAFLHHSFPDSFYIRILDWISALVLITVLFNLAHTTQQTGVFLAVGVLILFLVWLTSFIAFRNEYFLIYNISHAAWHILSAIFIFLLTTKFFTP